MNESASSHLIDKINAVLQSKRDCTVNIVNDKLTLSVFTLLSDNLRNVREINFIIRDTRFLPETEEVAREFEIEANPKEMLFNQYDIVEKNRLTHFATAKAMCDFIEKHVNIRITRPPHNIHGNLLTISVGLGKTFEALAVIKYFELRQDNVLVLTPVKLFDNWNSFRNPYKDNIVNDIFNYKILSHTDLSRYCGESRSGIDLSRIDWSKFDLIVIDESHNFRNRTERDDGFTRYQRLLDECVKKNQNTKVLLLSATPVNNSLNYKQRHT